MWECFPPPPADDCLHCVTVLYVLHTQALTCFFLPLLTFALQSASPADVWLQPGPYYGHEQVWRPQPHGNQRTGTFITFLHLCPCVCLRCLQTSGYNLAHNLAMSIFGGLSPMAISALALKLPPPALAAGVLLLLWAALAVAAAAPLVRLVPRINAREPAGGL